MVSSEHLLLVIIASYVASSDVELEIHHRHKRQLLFPNSTILQFNAGIGMPAIAKNMNVNYAFQANFQLPWNRTQIPFDILLANSGFDGDARRKRDTSLREGHNGGYQDDAKLYHFYKHVESVLDGFGYKGKACVLQTLCQLGAEPLHSDDEEDLLHEMATFVLNPKNDGPHISEDDHTYPYIKAFTDGEDRKDCTKIYPGCSTSLIDAFTKLHGH